MQAGILGCKQRTLGAQGGVSGLDEGTVGDTGSLGVQVGDPGVPAGELEVQRGFGVQDEQLGVQRRFWGCRTGSSGWRRGGGDARTARPGRRMSGLRWPGPQGRGDARDWV